MEPSVPVTIVNKQTPPYMYMKLQLEFDSEEARGPPPDIDVILFKSILVKALAQLHGDTGAAVPLDVLKYESPTRRAIVRVAGDELVKLWTSVTLFSSYSNHRCRITVEKVSPYLISLTKDSRKYEHRPA